VIGGDHPVWTVLAGLGPAERLVLVCYAAHAGEDGLAWPSLGTLAEKTGYSRDQLWRARRSLQRQGHLVAAGVGPSSRGQNANRYRISVRAHADTLLSASARTDGEGIRAHATRGIRAHATQVSAPTRHEEPRKNQQKNQGIARRVLDDWWKRQTPRPQQPYPAALKVLTKALRDGWTEDDLRHALDEVPTISGGTLDYWHRNRHRTNGSSAKSTEQMAAESEARIRRTMGLGA
jgi:hypothetical protein